MLEETGVPGVISDLEWTTTFQSYTTFGNRTQAATVTSERDTCALSRGDSYKEASFLSFHLRFIITTPGSYSFCASVEAWLHLFDMLCGTRENYIKLCIV